MSCTGGLPTEAQPSVCWFTRCGAPGIDHLTWFMGGESKCLYKCVFHFAPKFDKPVFL